MSKLLLASLTLFVSIPCFAQIGAPDANCNPSVDPPVSGGGCTWYNYYLVPNGTPAGTATTGSSFHNYYANAGNPPWTVTTTVPTVLRVVDGGHQGDVFAVYDNGVELGTSTLVSVDPNHSCANDPTGTGTDPAACWNDPLMSHGVFQLPAGAHSITINWAQMVPGGMSSLQWFEIGNVTTTSGGLPFVGSMPQIASQDDWMTTITLVNTASSPAQMSVNAYATNGLPLTLPLDLVQSSTNSLAASLNQTLSSNASLIVQSSGPATASLLTGGAQVGASGGEVGGFAIFHINSSSQEAVVPLETRNAASYFLAFDDTNNIATGVAIENISGQAVTVNAIIRDDTGAVLQTDPIALPASGQASFVLSTQYSVTANIRGSVEFDTPANGQISVLGIRYTPPGTITSIPVLAGVGTSGGSFEHIAAGAGWLTTFVLMNTGATTATAQLSFFDDSGAPLAVSLLAPQTNVTTGATSVVNTALNPNQILVLQTNTTATSALQTGSAQLVTSGNVSGYVIFHYSPNGQEAVTPLESRNAGAYVVAFDNTANTVTGIAVNNAANSAANIPVVLRDSNGNQIGTSSLALGANGHTSFQLFQQFPATANIQGTIEFDTPVGGSIGALGIRTPPALTFTTLPSLAK